MENLSFVLALEGTAPTASSTTLERVLEYLVRRVQPEPSITHIELFISPLEDGDDPHFATYMGNDKTDPPKPYTAGWGTAFEGGETEADTAYEMGISREVIERFLKAFAKVTTVCTNIIKCFTRRTLSQRSQHTTQIDEFPISIHNAQAEKINN